MGFYKGNKVSQESAVLDSFKTDIKMLPAKTNKIVSIKDLASQALSDRLNGNLMLFKGKLINFKFFINRYKETISNLNRMLNNIDKYVKMDSEDSYKLILQNIAHIAHEFNQYTLGEKELDTMVRSDNVDGIYLKTYAMYTTIKKRDNNQNAKLVIDFATFGYDTSSEGGIYGFMEESDDWVTTVTSVNITPADTIVSGTIDLNKLYDAVLDAYNYYKKIDVIKPKPFKTGTTEYKIQYVISDVVDRTVNAYKNLLDNIISIYKELANLDLSVSTESEDTELTSNVDIPSEVDPEPATIEDAAERDITNSEFQETSKDLEEAIETSDELESVGSEVQEELDAVNERLESEEPIDPVDVTVVNESIQHYSKLLGLTRESVNLSLEDVRNNSRESMEGLKVELEGIGEKIKEYAKKAWTKIIELLKKFVEFLFNIRKSINRKIQNILTNGLEIPDKDFELTYKERTVLTFGFKYLIDSYTKAIEVLSQAAGKAGEKLLKMDIKTSADDATRIGEEAGVAIRDMANKLKPEDNNPNINMRYLLNNMKGQFSRDGEKLLALLPFAANDETGNVDAIAISITSNSGNTGVVTSGVVHFTDIKTVKDYSIFVDKVYRDKDYMTKEVSALKSLGDWNKSYLDNLFKLGTLLAKRQDEHMNQPGLEGVNNQSPIYYGSLEHCKKVIKSVLALGRNYITTVDCFVKYVEKHFVKYSDSKTVTPA